MGILLPPGSYRTPHQLTAPTPLPIANVPTDLKYSWLYGRQPEDDAKKSYSGNLLAAL
jgi:hypothetical protein